MPSSATLRLEIERSLEGKFPAALTPVPRTIREVAPTGIDEVDRLLDGGIPVGAITEVVGPVSSGRTSLALAFLGGRTAEGQACAWVDTADALDPESAAANGVELKHLLWVRCGEGREASTAEQPTTQRMRAARPWPRLEQAIRATDLLLQTGGFAAIVLDLGDTAPEHGMRIPLATWFRFRQAADRGRCCLLVLSRARYAQSSAALALECTLARVQTAGETALRGCSFAVQRARERFAVEQPHRKKPPASTWSAASTWAAEKRT